MIWRCVSKNMTPNVELRGTDPIGEASLSNEGFGVSADTEKGD